VWREWEVVVNECGVEDYSYVMRWLVVGAVCEEREHTRLYIHTGATYTGEFLRNFSLLLQSTNKKNYRQRREKMQSCPTFSLRPLVQETKTKSTFRL